MAEGPLIPNKNKIWRGLRPLVKLQFGIERYTPEVVDFFVNVLQEISAVRIQAAWRGYVARKEYGTLRHQLRREKAAVTIQRFFREWLYKKKMEELFRTVKKDKETELLKLTKEEVDQRIMDWRMKHNIFSVVVPDDEEELDREIERKMKQFYQSQKVSEARALKLDKLCASIDHLFSNLTDITSLFEKDEIEVNKYSLGTRRAVARAQSAVQQNLKYMNAPWWRRLEYELSGNYNDVYFPSEVDVCEQFIKKTEEK